MRKVSHLVVALMLAMAFLPLHALATPVTEPDGPPIMLFYTHTSAITAELSISGGSASCSGSVTPDSGYSASVRVVLYRSSDGNNWTEIASWSGSGTNGSTASASGSKSVSSGYKYKVTAFGTVKSGSTVVESPTKSTAVKSY